MDNQTKTIFVLLAVITILAGIFVLKATGIIKATEKNIPEEQSTEVETEEITDADMEKMILKLQAKALRTILFIKIAIIVFFIFSDIGIAKLYKKIGMPSGYVYYQYFSMAISVIFVIFNINSQFLNIISGIIAIFVLAKYFEAIGMSKIWPVELLVSIITMFYCIYKISPYILLGINIPMQFIIIGLLGIFGVITYLVMYEISNYRLAKLFEKSTVFTVLLLVFPFIFRPILGYSRD